jgi:hypothetical protein
MFLLILCQNPWENLPNYILKTTQGFRSSFFLSAVIDSPVCRAASRQAVLKQKTL